MMTTRGYSRFVFVMCGVCGLVFGIDLGIVGAALPYIKETVGFTEAQLSSVTAAVLLSLAVAVSVQASGINSVLNYSVMIMDRAGVCVHLALTELMPTRIRAAGMLVATMCNNAVSFTIAQTFLPWSKAWGSSAVFFTLSGFMALFFFLVTVFLPETKGKSLEEIERMFAK